MYLDKMADKTRYYKENDKGVSYMCKLMEDYVKEAEYQRSLDFALKMLQRGKLTLEEISDYSDLPLETIKELAEQMKPA